MAGAALPPALLTLRWKMDCNNNCWPSGRWAVKELLRAGHPAEQLTTDRPVGPAGLQLEHLKPV